MAKDLFDHSDEIKNIYKQANQILGYDLAGYSFAGPEETLKQTQITQPAIFVHSVALLSLLSKKSTKPAMAAGHSLGEYTALYAAGVLAFDEALRLIKVRAEQMQKAGEIDPGSMAAVIGLPVEELQAACKEASATAVVQVANYNSPAQLVISGSVDGVRKAMDLASARGAKRVIPLVVSGAFHSPLMEFARDGLQTALDAAAINKARFPVYTNVNARPVIDPDDIKQLLLQQLTSPVRWVEIVENMIRDGASEFYEIGPGSVLTGLLKRIDRNVNGLSVSSLDDLEKIV